MKNGVLNLKTGELEDHDRANRNTYYSDIEYLRHEEPKRWVKFIDQVTCGDKELASYLKKVCGYCLSGLVDEQAMFVLLGDGANGKSVFARMLLKILGPMGGPVSQSLLTMGPAQHPTQFANLYGKRVVVAQETDAGCRLSEAQVKELTGGDLIQCRRMREDFWEFEPTHKIFLATNYRPRIVGSDHGIWRRIRILPFNAKFEGEAQDKNLERDLHKELPGILEWMLDGWIEMQQFGFDEPQVSLEAKREYRGDMDSIGQFLEDCCEFGEEYTVSNADLYQHYKFYSEQNGEYVRSADSLGRELTKRGLKTFRTSQIRGRKGVRIRPATLE